MVRQLLVPPAVPALAADPEAASSSNRGAMYFNTATGKLRYSDGSQWVEAGTGGGAANMFIAVGTDGESISKVTAVLGAQSLGTEGDSLAISARQATVPVGTDRASLAVSSDTGSGSRSVGTDAESMTMSQSGQFPLGGDGASMAASLTLVGTGWATAASQTRNSGTHDWSPTANATGNFDGSFAAISAAATTMTADSFDATLKMTTFGLATTPSGFSRTKVEVIIKHQWDTTVAVVDTVTLTVEIRKSGGTSPLTVMTKTQATASQGALLEETVDMTSAVSGWTDTEVKNAEVWCNAVCSLGAITAANASWAVDGSQIRVTFTKSGIA